MRGHCRGAVDGPWFSDPWLVIIAAEGEQRQFIV